MDVREFLAGNAVAIGSSLIGLALLLPSSFGQGSSNGAEVSPVEAVFRLHLAHRDGVASLHYSACCRERAIEIQNSVQDLMAFYRERLGAGGPIAVAVLNKNDWDDVAQQIADHRFQPYGMPNFQVAPSGYILFIPADDNGVVTQHLLGNRHLATADSLRLFASAHLTYDEAVHRAIVLMAYHETGHTLVYEYGIGQTNHFLNEILANYFAYGYAKTRDPETATVFEGFSTLGTPPGAYTSLEDFESHWSDMPPANYDWYQLQFGLRVLEIYNEQGLGFLSKVKSVFPKGTPEMSVADTLTRLEEISPGFQAWARKMTDGLSQSPDTLHTLR
jgi:hypothetical protein